MKFIEELIKDAQKQGKFNGLKSDGKPVKLDDSPYTQDTRIAYGMVKEAGYTLGFLADRKKIDQLIHDVCENLQEAADRYTGNSWSDMRWAKATALFREEAGEVNKKIRTYNLKAPNEQFHIIPIWIDREIEKRDPRRSGD